MCVCVCLTRFTISLTDSSQICEAQTKTINCGPHNVFKIHAANYGRTNSTICSDNQPPHKIDNTNCSSSNTLSVVKESCDGRLRCSIKASNRIFSNPCPGIYKYLDISYSCVPLTSSKTCEGNISTLDCGLDVIKIHAANYGRTDGHTCSVGRAADEVTNTRCRTSLALGRVKDRCDGKERCTLVASNHFSNGRDRCPGTYKYLDISFSCVTEM
ncbi:L-rhamnose-binding lectin CSL3-like [Clupea harengus]|nr:L-rhamnose-binding lectin CSL3-like [Clupea harengus]